MISIENNAYAETAEKPPILSIQLEVHPPTLPTAAITNGIQALRVGVMNSGAMNIAQKMFNATNKIPVNGFINAAAGIASGTAAGVAAGAGAIMKTVGANTSAAMEMVNQMAQAAKLNQGVHNAAMAAAQTIPVASVILNTAVDGVKKGAEAIAGGVQKKVGAALLRAIQSHLESDRNSNAFTAITGTGAHFNNPNDHFGGADFGGYGGYHDETVPQLNFHNLPATFDVQSSPPFPAPHAPLIEMHQLPIVIPQGTDPPERLLQPVNINFVMENSEASKDVKREKISTSPPMSRKKKRNLKAKVKAQAKEAAAAAVRQAQQTTHFEPTVGQNSQGAFIDFQVSDHVVTIQQQHPAQDIEMRLDPIDVLAAGRSPNQQRKKRKI